MWLSQLQAYAGAEIWPHIDPDKDGEESLLEKPTRPNIRDINENASRYEQLSPEQQKVYENSRKFYEQDLRQYQRQEDLMRGARSYISTTVSTQKKSLLDQNDSTYDWLVKLKEDTKPSEAFMRRKVHEQYLEALKGLKPNKVSQWLDRWENAITLVKKYNLPQKNNGIWLQDLAQAIRPLSESLFTIYLRKTKEESGISEYRTVAMELREILSISSKKTTTTTARGSAFNADFGEEDPATEESKGKGRSRSRKRAGTISIEEESSSTKKSKNSKCPACGIKGHALPDCWTLFEKKRPDGYKPTEALAKKVRDKLAHDKDLAAEVEKLRKEAADDEA